MQERVQSFIRRGSLLMILKGIEETNKRLMLLLWQLKRSHKQLLILFTCFSGKETTITLLGMWCFKLRDRLKQQTEVLGLTKLQQLIISNNPDVHCNISTLFHSLVSLQVSRNEHSNFLTVQYNLSR